MQETSRYTFYVLIIFAVFSAALALVGYFQIGLLSDDYIDINGAVHSTLKDKLTGNIPFANPVHLRTTHYLSLQSSAKLHDLLGFAYDDFLLYRIQNLLLYLLLAYATGRILLYVTGHLSIALIASITTIIFSNNINNICWTDARVDLLCGIFYLLALYFAFKYVKEKDQTSFVCSILSFIFALLTKETSLTVPFITAVFICAIYGKSELLKNKWLIIVQLFIIASYAFYKLVVLGNNAGDMLAMYQSSPLANAPGVIARAAIALTIPLDFLTLNLYLREKNHLLAIYLACLYGGVFYLISVMVRNEIYKYLGYIALSLAILILPNIFIGYIRTQMILVPFILLSILVFWGYDHQLKNSIHINKLLLKIFFFAALCYWCYTSLGNISDWSYSYSRSKQEVQGLISSGENLNRSIVIGAPGRYKQAFLFDNLTGAYSFWKNKGFVVTDTINDIVQTGALDRASLSAPLVCKQTTPGEFEIAATGPGQYFYIEGFDNERIKNGFRNRDMSVDFRDFNILNKPTKLNLKIFSQALKCYLCSDFKFTEIQ